MESYIFDIKRYSINDGPGIRITLFFKGCPLSCAWCHNPEGMSPAQSKMYTLNKCIGCGSCIGVCPNGALSMDKGGKGVITDKTKCVCCGKCAEVCPSKAMEMAGKIYSVDQIMKEIRKEKPFFEESGGGVTFCGGEPLMHRNLLLSILKECGKESFHRTVDTSLYASEEVVREVAANCELFLVDLKLMDNALHKKYTGVSNTLIHKNIGVLAELEKKFIIRIPLIDGVNSDDTNIIASAKFLASLPGDSPIVELLPYHDIAKGKHARLGTVYNSSKFDMATPSAQRMEEVKKLFGDYGIKAI